MKIEIKILDTLFRRVLPEEIQRKVQHQEITTVFYPEADYKELFCRFMDSEVGGFSEDEQSVIFQGAWESTRAWLNRIGKQRISALSNQEMSLPIFALASVGQMADTLLCQCGEEPCCKIEEVLNWRDAFLRLGQDLFVCAFLAKEDRKARRQRKQFAWPAVIRTNYVPLNTLLSKGLTENHQHLYGSSQIFSLNWMGMMNFPEAHSRISQVIPNYRQPLSVDRDYNRLLSLSEKVRLACNIRLYLFWETVGYRKDTRNTVALAKILQDYTVTETLGGDLAYTRYNWGAKVPQKGGKADVLDYALTTDVFAAVSEDSYRSLSGERALLYNCFRSFYEGSMDTTTAWAFYLYILLKLQFRSELIQNNQKSGFENFSIYQKRKTALTQENISYKAELIRMALVAPRKKEHVVSLETRISPKNTPEENYKLIMSDIEAFRRFAEYGDIDDIQSRKGTPLKEKHEVFYVFHFTKNKDRNLGKETLMLTTYRHSEKRKGVRKQSLALAEALSLYEDMSCLVRGIDSASNEIGCPPEVFANAFRFLKNFRETDYRASPAMPTVRRRPLSATYHAGEDFLDIASALRAIDEAVVFLDLERGDRIGHALGLGVLPSIHYGLKNYRIFLPKQDRLDDLVWLLYRGQELGVRIDPELRSRLSKEAERLLMEIYQPLFERERWSVSLTDYHCIMQLRGDDPVCYRSGHFEPILMPETQYEEYAVSYRDEARNSYRENRMFSSVYYHYHYDFDVKKKGNEIYSVEVGRDYMELLKQVQDKLQVYLQEKGIIIECNPSSNVMIGTFRNYQNHPIFRLHKIGLESGFPVSESNGDMQVCVNTDDLGVFDTSLEFEYALLLQALRERKNPDGSRCFRDTELLEYLEHLRIMGHWAVFPQCDICLES